MKSYKQFREENHNCKAGEYYCYTDQKCKPIPSGYKVDEDGMLMKNEDAPANNVGGGNIAGVGIGAAGEPGIKKKKKKLIIGTIKRNIQENFDNNNVLLKQVLDGLDRVDVAIDTINTPKTKIQVVKEQPKKSFKEKYNVR